MQNRRRSEYHPRLLSVSDFPEEEEEKHNIRNLPSPGLHPPLSLSTSRCLHRTDPITKRITKQTRLPVTEQFNKHRLSPGGTAFGSPHHLVARRRRIPVHTTNTWEQKRHQSQRSRRLLELFFGLDGKVRLVASKRRIQSIQI